MANNNQLIDVQTAKAFIAANWPNDPLLKQIVFNLLDKLPRVDAVEVDEIRVDIMRLCLENQEAILNVSICGKPNEVKLPFSKEVVEVVHSSWILNDDGSGTCKHCHRTTKSCWDFDNQMNYCPNCGADMR